MKLDVLKQHGAVAEPTKTCHDLGMPIQTVAIIIKEKAKYEEIAAIVARPQSMHLHMQTYQNLSSFYIFSETCQCVRLVNPHSHVITLLHLATHGGRGIIPPGCPLQPRPSQTGRPPRETESAKRVLGR